MTMLHSSTVKREHEALTLAAGPISDSHAGDSRPSAAPQCVRDDLRNLKRPQGVDRCPDHATEHRHPSLRTADPRSPLANDSTCHGLKGDLEFVAHKGPTRRHQHHELSNGARTWPTSRAKQWSCSTFTRTTPTPRSRPSPAQPMNLPRFRGQQRMEMDVVAAMK